MGAPVLVHHDIDPADEIREDVGVLCDEFQPIGADILIVMYERINTKGGEERKTAGGLLIPTTAKTTASDDKFQGKVGLVMKMGPIAFTEDDQHRWGGVVPKVGDWVIVNINETFSFDLPVYSKGRSRAGSPDGERRARMVQDVYVRGIVSKDAFNTVW